MGIKSEMKKKKTALMPLNLQKRFLLKALAFSSLLIITACGQDRTLSEYRNAQVELELNKYLSIQGTYRGLAYQQNSLKPLGDVEIQLFANTIVDSDGLRREARPVLQSYVTLRMPGHDEIVVSMDSGFYLPEEKLFKTALNTVRSGTNRTLQLEGTIQKEQIRGKISVFGYQRTALILELEKNQDWPSLEPSSYAKDRFPNVPPRSEIKYSGYSTYLDGRKMKATMKLLNNSINATGAMVDLLMPIRVFTGIIDTDKNTLRFSFSNMIWDAEAKTLSGVSQRGGIDAVEIRTDCVEQNSSNSEGWSCTYTSSLGGILSGFEFSRDSATLTTSNVLAVK